MKNDKEILTSLLISVQKNMISLKNALRCSMLPNLRKILSAQLHELEIIETAVFTTANRHGIDLNDMDIGLRFFCFLGSRLRLCSCITTSRIAACMIQANTSATITILSTLHRSVEERTHIQLLAQKIIDCEAAYIRHLQNYL